MRVGSLGNLCAWTDRARNLSEPKTGLVTHKHLHRNCHSGLRLLAPRLVLRSAHLLLRVRFCTRLICTYHFRDTQPYALLNTIQFEIIQFEVIVRRRGFWFEFRLGQLQRHFEIWIRLSIFFHNRLCAKGLLSQEMLNIPEYISCSLTSKQLDSLWCRHLTSLNAYYSIRSAISHFSLIVDIKLGPG